MKGVSARMIRLTVLHYRQQGLTSLNVTDMLVLEGHQISVQKDHDWPTRWPSHSLKA